MSEIEKLEKEFELAEKQERAKEVLVCRQYISGVYGYGSYTAYAKSVLATEDARLALEDAKAANANFANAAAHLERMGNP